MNIQRTSTIFNTDDAIVDVGQTTCDESESPVKAEKAEKVSFLSNRPQLARFKH